MHEVMEVQKSANCNLRGYFNQLFFSCRAGNIYTALLHVVFICATVLKIRGHTESGPQRTGCFTTQAAQS